MENAMNFHLILNCFNESDRCLKHSTFPFFHFDSLHFSCSLVHQTAQVSYVRYWNWTNKRKNKIEKIKKEKMENNFGIVNIVESWTMEPKTMTTKTASTINFTLYIEKFKLNKSAEWDNHDIVCSTHRPKSKAKYIQTYPRAHILSHTQTNKWIEMKIAATMKFWSKWFCLGKILFQWNFLVLSCFSLLSSYSFFAARK